MNKNKTIRIVYAIALVLLCLGLVNAISLDQLLSSYNMDYDAQYVSITSIDHSGLDVGGSAKYDYLVVNVSMDTQADDYKLIGELYNDHNIVQSKEFQKTYGAGLNKAKFNFSAKSLEYENYNFSVKIYNESGLILRKHKNYSLNINRELYENKEMNLSYTADTAIDNQGDVRYDLLMINLTLNSSIAETVNIYAYLYDNESNFVNIKQPEIIGSGTQTVSLNFDSKDIREKMLNSTLYLKKVIIKTSETYYNYNINQTLSQYNYIDFDPKKTVFSNSFREYNISSTKIDQLIINVSVDVNESKTYSFEAAIHDTYDNFILEIKKNISLTQGQDNILIIMNSTDMYLSKKNGPYYIGYMKLRDGSLLDYSEKPYFTKEYTYDDFTKPPLPELYVDSEDIYLDTSVNYTTVNFTLQNLGTASAFSANIRLYNNRSERIGETTLEKVENQTTENILVHRVNITNTDLIKLLIDIDDEIEELNDSNNYVEFSLLPDTTAPVITINNPANSSNISYTLISTSINITTDESAVCRYNLTDKDFDFSEGTDFNITGTKKHSFILNGLTSGSSYVLYYVCNDSDGNINSNSEIHFFAVDPDLTPTASITSSETSGLAPLTVYFNATAISGNLPLNYSWDFDNNGVADNMTQNTSYTFAAPGFYTVNLTVTDADGDKSYASVEITAIADTVPICTIVSSPTSGIEPLNVYLNSSVAGGNAPYNISWDYTNDGTIDSYLNNTNNIYSSGVYIVNLTVEDNDGDMCHNTTTINVEADLMPGSSASANVTSGIEPLCVYLNGTATSGNLPLTYSWDYTNDGSTDSTTEDSEYCYSAGNYVANFTVTDANGDTSYSSVSITVDADLVPAPIISPNTTSGLAPLSVEFDGIVNSGNLPLIYSWDFTNNGITDNTSQNTSYVFAAPGFYDVNFSVSDANNDVNSTILQISVISDTVPICSIVSSSTNGVELLDVYLNSSVAGGNAPYTIGWDYTNDGTIDSTQNNTGHIYSSGSYVVNLTVEDNDGDMCYDSVAVNVEADLMPSSSASANITSGIEPLCVYLNGTATSGNLPLTYSWDYTNDGSTDSTNEDSEYCYSAGNYVANFTVTDANGDKSYSSVSITVDADTVPILSIFAAPTSGIEPLTVELNASVTNGNLPLTYSWDFTNDRISDNNSQKTSYTFNSPGAYLVNLTVVDFDGDTVHSLQSITVDADTIPDCNIIVNPNTGIEPLNVLFNSTITNGNLPYTYAWDYTNDGTVDSTQESTSNVFNSGSYVVNFTVTDVNGDKCYASADVNVDANLMPSASLSTNTTSGLENLCISFNATGTGGNLPLTYSWDFDNNGVVDSTTENIVYCYPAGNYIANLTITDANGDKSYDSVAITSIADTQPSASITANSTSGLEPLSVNFDVTVNNGNAPYTYLWDFGDGSSSTTKVSDHTFSSEGVYNVQVTVTDADGDIDTDNIQIEVQSDPIVDALADTISGIEPLTVNFDADITNKLPIMNYAWDIDNDGVVDYTTKSPQHTYSETGLYVAEVTVCNINRCITDNITINVGDNNLVLFDIDSDVTSGLEPLSVSFTSNIIAADLPVTYNWDFDGDGNIDSIQENPSYTYNDCGTYIARLTVEDVDGDTNSSIITIDVLEDLIPDPTINADTTTGVMPLTVNFGASVDSGNLPLTHSWDFNNNGTIESTEQQASYTYDVPGLYYVNLTVTDNDGDKVSVIKEIAVTPTETETFLLKAAAFDFDDSSKILNPSVVVINDEHKFALPVAYFNVTGDDIILVTNAAVGYQDDSDTYYFDSGIKYCSGVTCNMQSTSQGETFTTTCTYSQQYEDWECIVTNDGVSIAYFYKPLDNRLTIANYLQKE